MPRETNRAEHDPGGGRDAPDSSHRHMAGAYGVVSGPSRAAAYNLVISGTRLAAPCLGARRGVSFLNARRGAARRSLSKKPQHFRCWRLLASAPRRARECSIHNRYAFHGQSLPRPAGETPWGSLLRFYHSKVRPGLLFSTLRDCGSVGGGLVLAPHLRPFLGDSPPAKFAGGLASGAFCGRRRLASARVETTAPRGAAFLAPLPGSTANKPRRASRGGRKNHKKQPKESPKTYRRPRDAGPPQRSADGGPPRRGRRGPRLPRGAAGLRGGARRARAVPQHPVPRGRHRRLDGHPEPHRSLR